MRVEGVDGSQRMFTSTVALVTTDFDGRTNVMSAEWSLRVSLDPYLVAVFVGQQRGTLDLIESSGEFGLNYCSDEQAELAHVAGNNSILEGKDKWSIAEFRTFRGKNISAPLIEGCISNLECRVVDSFRTGDHTAFVGEVLNAYHDEEKSPLIYHGGRFYSIGKMIRRL
jgi:flavin reductase (DIM6/NTAB) family NADH-FMN oxidoreductase RutF